MERRGACTSGTVQVPPQGNAFSGITFYIVCGVCALVVALLAVLIVALRDRHLRRKREIASEQLQGRSTSEMELNNLSSRDSIPTGKFAGSETLWQLKSASDSKTSFVLMILFEMGKTGVEIAALVYYVGNLQNAMLNPILMDTTIYYPAIQWLFMLYTLLRFACASQNKKEEVILWFRHFDLPPGTPGLPSLSIRLFLAATVRGLPCILEILVSFMHILDKACYTDVPVSVYLTFLFNCVQAILLRISLFRWTNPFFRVIWGAIALAFIGMGIWGQVTYLLQHEVYSYYVECCPNVGTNGDTVSFTTGRLFNSTAVFTCGQSAWTLAYGPCSLNAIIDESASQAGGTCGGFEYQEAVCSLGSGCTGKIWTPIAEYNNFELNSYAMGDVTNACTWGCQAAKIPNC